MKQQSKILIVDSDPNYVESTKNILEGQAFAVTSASNRKEAWDQINHFHPDLIILAIMMEKMNDGFEICYELKHNPEKKHIPVFAISSINQVSGFNFSPETDGEYFQADDFAEKPINAKDLIDRIHTLLTYRKN